MCIYAYMYLVDVSLEHSTVHVCDQFIVGLPSADKGLVLCQHTHTMHTVLLYISGGKQPQFPQ